MRSETASTFLQLSFVSHHPWSMESSFGSHPPPRHYLPHFLTSSKRRRSEDEERRAEEGERERVGQGQEQEIISIKTMAPKQALTRGQVKFHQVSERLQKTGRVSPRLDALAAFLMCAPCEQRRPLRALLRVELTRFARSSPGTSCKSQNHRFSQSGETCPGGHSKPKCSSVSFQSSDDPLETL